jgi:hypothetical protein
MLLKIIIIILIIIIMENNETIRVGIKINLEMKPTIIRTDKNHKKILKLNFYEVDKIKNLKNITSVIAYEKISLNNKENDLNHINLIIKFCEVTKLPLKIYIKNDLSNKITNKLKRHNINYKTFNF